MKRMRTHSIPLCVDLDGLVRRPPPSAARDSDAANAESLHADSAALCYDARVIEWLRAQDVTRPRILCTTADRATAQAIAAHVGGFDEVFTMDEADGAPFARTLAARFGTRGFDYAGRAPRDSDIWRHARRAVVIDPPADLLRRIAGDCEVEHVFARERGGWRAWLRAVRPHQWLKNVLVFVPLMAAHRLFDPLAVGSALLAFVGFGLCASAAYVTNDLFDLEADRQHPRKRLRPFASGVLSVRAGAIAAPLLALCGLGLAYLRSPAFALVLGVYALATLAYSLALKRVAMLDVVTLAALYTVRIIGGAVAIPVPASFWLLALSMFLFLSLAMLKRYAELRGALDRGQKRIAGRDYGVADLSLVEALGTSSGYIAVLVFALYIDSTASQALYRHHEFLWALTPVLLYWISRAWLVARRGGMHDDPVVFALTDRVSLVLVAVAAAVGVAAI